MSPLSRPCGVGPWRDVRVPQLEPAHVFWRGATHHLKQGGLRESRDDSLAAGRRLAALSLPEAWDQISRRIVALSVAAFSGDREGSLAELVPEVG